MERDTENKVTLEELHEKLKNIWKDKQTELLTVLDLKGESSYYNIIYGKKKIREIEKPVVAALFGKSVDEIDWDYVKNDAVEVFS